MYLRRLFSNKEQKRLRRAYDAQKGEERLRSIDPGSAEFAFHVGEVNYPGERVNRVFREGGNWHYKTTLRDGVTPEKAKQLEENAKKFYEDSPKMKRFNMDLVTGRGLLHGTSGYSDDLTNLNQRINSRALGETVIGEEEALEELRRRKKKNGWKSYEQRIKESIEKESKKSPIKKKAGKICAGVVLASGAAYGGYKAYKHNKDKKKSE